MYKLLLLDIDGTLRDEYAGIPQSAIQAIQMCRAKNCQVVICTGRSVGTIQEDVKAIEVDGYICGGGCYIQYKKEILWDISLPQKKIKEVLCLLQEKKAAFAIESKDKVYMNQGAKEIFDHMNMAKCKQINVNKQFIQETITYENNIHTFHNEPIHKICLWTTDELYKEVESKLGNEIELAQQDIYEDLNYYEIIRKDFHKGAAIQHLQTYLNIQKEDTICFGDGGNDIEMFKASGCGIAMKHSHICLKKQATSICEDIFEDGLFKELKRRKLIDEENSYE